jgi:AcrR family transcriptional regulator
MDGRIERGDRTRKAVAAQAAAIASVDGLAGMTLSQLADRLGVSKSSVQAAYRTKEDLQVAAVAAATEIFASSVVAPAQEVPDGVPRLWALIDNWLAYIERRDLPGGCFMGATLAEYDSHPGVVRDALARARRQWLRLLEHHVKVAQSAGDLTGVPSADLVAFEIDALLAAANVARNLTDDVAPLIMARKLLVLRLANADLRPT